MGVDFGDVDGDGDEDLFVTNLDNEGNTFYRNQGRGLFEDRTVEAGLFKLGSTGFGTRLFDYDNDGWLDLAVANGAVRHLTAQVQAGDPYPLKQRNQLFHNERRAALHRRDRSRRARRSPRSRVSRGLAAGDLDNDGATDLVVFNNSGPVRVLMNEAARGRHWLGVRVLDERGREALGAVVEIARGNGRLSRRVHVDGSYGVASDPRVILGLGSDAATQTVRVRWPGGRMESFAGLAVDRYWVLQAGKPPRDSPSRTPMRALQACRPVMSPPLRRRAGASPHVPAGAAPTAGAQETLAPARAGLDPVPLPSLEGLEPAVAAQLVEARAAFARAAADSTASRGDLGSGLRRAGPALSRLRAVRLRRAGVSQRRATAAVAGVVAAPARLSVSADRPVRTGGRTPGRRAPPAAGESRRRHAARGRVARAEPARGRARAVRQPAGGVSGGGSPWARRGVAARAPLPRSRRAFRDRARARAAGRRRALLAGHGLSRPGAARRGAGAARTARAGHGHRRPIRSSMRWCR